jgi:hypothetical protein
MSPLLSYKLFSLEFWWRALGSVVVKALGFTQSLTEVSTRSRKIMCLGSRARPVRQLYRWITLTKMYLLLGRKSKLSTSNKLLIYKTILKLIWTYWIQLWGTASTSNIAILERFQWKALRMIVDAPWYVPNTVSPQRTSKWPVVNLIELPDNKNLPNDPPTGFLV